MTKLIIVAGGSGTRIHELTGSVLPKSLCRLSSELPKPLVAYQLEQVAKAGFSDVMLIFNYDWQEQLFRQLIRIKEVPDLNYTITSCRWGHPLYMFEVGQVIDFIGLDDFVLTYGDLFYSQDLLHEMQSLATRNNTSVASLMFSTSDRWRDGEKKITFSKDDDGRVTEYGLTATGSFTMHAPFFFQNRALETIFEELTHDPPRTVPLLKRLVTKQQLSVFCPNFLLNMNFPEDISTMEQAILKFN